MAAEDSKFYTYASDDDAGGAAEKSADFLLPDSVRTFITDFFTAFRLRQVFDFNRFYGTEWSRQTDKYFTKQAWPSVDEIRPLVSDDAMGAAFVTVYNLLKLRHQITTKGVKSGMDTYVESWEAYKAFFVLVLDDEDDLGVELPSAFLYELLSEFIYELQSVNSLRSGSKKGLSEEEAARMSDYDDAWGIVDVFRYLQALVDMSRVKEHLASARTLPSGLLPLLGYFSLVTLCRLYAQLGDYATALRTVEILPLANEAVFSRAAACHITLYYYMGFCMMMSRRFLDALRTFSRATLYYHRTKHLHSGDYVMKRKADQMLALLAVCVVLCPQQKPDDQVAELLKEKHDDTMQRMIAGDALTGEDPLTAFKGAFEYASPSYIESPSVLMHAEAPTSDLHNVQLRAFLREVKQRIEVLPKVRSYMRLYKNITASKLASYCADGDEAAALAQLRCLKIKMYQRLSTDTNPVAGEWGSADALDFHIDGDTVHMTEVPVVTDSSSFFRDSAVRFEKVRSDVARIKVRPGR